MRMFLVVLMFFSSMAMAKEVVLTKDNTLVLNTAFTSESVSDLMGKAMRMDAELKSGYPIYLFLDTPGGSIQAGLELIEFFKGINRPVHTVTLFAASMGWQLAQHLGNRYILQYGVLMSHKAYGGFRGEFGGEGSQLDSRYSLWLRRLAMMDNQTVARTNGKKTLKQYQSEYDNELWLNGEEAVKSGYADELVSVKCSASLSGNEKKDVEYEGFKMVFVFDKCPIRTGPVDVRAELRTNRGYISLDNFLKEGGIFENEKCQMNDSEETKDYYGNIIKPAQKAQLCLIDKSVSFEKIQKIMKTEAQKISDKRRQIVKMSFGSFIAE